MDAINIAGFEILELLGEGPMSTVWKAHQVSLNRIVAIKVLKQKFTGKPNEVHPVLKEARAAAALKHPNIIPIYDAGELDGTFYFVMEFIAGSTIGKLIQEGAISPKSTLNAALIVSEALDHAWKTATLTHRGINPDNIMLDADGTLKIADLGLPKMADPSNLGAQLRDGTVQGKLNYISPEQAKCSIRIDFRTDMYGLGATLYHMVTGKMPFGDLEPKDVLNQHLTGFLKNPRDVNRSVSLGLAQLISKLMMKDYKARYADWTEVVSQVKKTAASKVQVSKSPEPTADGAEQPVSTIAPAKTSPAAKAKRKANFSFSAAVKDEPDPDAPPPLEVPWYIQLPTWGIILASWVLLAWSQLQLPALGLLSTPPAVVAPPPASIQPATAPPPQAPPTERTPEPVAPVPTVEDTEKNERAAFNDRVVSLLHAGELHKALALVNQEKEYSHSSQFDAELGKLREILGEAGRVPESYVSKNIGKEIPVNDKGRVRRVTVKMLVGDTLTADYTEKIGEAKVVRSVTIPLSKLDPSELLRHVGDENTPGKRLMKYVLYVRKGDLDAARKAASDCGPLSDLLAKAGEAKRPSE